MIPELGHFALWLALAVSLVMGVVPIWGSVTGREDWMALSRPLAWLMFALIGVSCAALTAAFIGNDFSVQYLSLIHI